MLHLTEDEIQRVKSLIGDFTVVTAAEKRESLLTTVLGIQPVAEDREWFVPEAEDEFTEFILQDEYFEVETVQHAVVVKTDPYTMEDDVAIFCGIEFGYTPFELAYGWMPGAKLGLQLWGPFNSASDALLFKVRFG